METVIVVNEVVVENRQQLEQLRAAGLLDSHRDNGRPIPRGPVRVVVREVSIKELLRTRGPIRVKTTGADEIAGTLRRYRILEKLRPVRAD